MKEYTIKFSGVGGNDLASEKLKCTCPNKSFIGTDIEHLMNHNITLWGYNDDYFFDFVNKEPRKFKCKCGREFSQQWFRGGKINIIEF